MARVYVKGYTKSDGTKVKGYYREVAEYTQTVRDQDAFYGLREFNGMKATSKRSEANAIVKILLKGYPGAQRKRVAYFK
jgi:hypothetical protein